MQTMMKTLTLAAALAAIATAGASTALAQAQAPAVPAGLQAALERNNADYAQLRAAILAQGWRPVVNPDCQVNVYGGTREEPIRPSGPNVCRILTEVESCSGDGYCNMYFSKAGQRTFLRVMTYGDYGAPSTMTVNGWEMSRTNGVAE
jgi:hypothetical protein